MQQFTRGLFGVLEGARLLLGKASLWPYLLVPLLINLLLFAGGIWWSVHYIGGLIDGLMAQLPGWLAWLSWLLWLVFALSAALLVFVSFNLVANLIAAPFNGLLAEAVARRLTDAPVAATGLREAIRSAPSAFVDELRKLLYFLIRAVPLGLLFLIPGINLAAPVVWLLFSAWVLALEYLDYPLGNAGLAFGEQRRVLGRRRLLTLGFGAGVLAASLVPLVNLIVMPAAVAGATCLWVRELAEGTGPGPEAPPA